MNTEALASIISLFVLVFQMYVMYHGLIFYKKASQWIDIQEAKELSKKEEMKNKEENG